MKLVVGPLESVGDLIRIHAPERVVSLLGPGQPGPRVQDRAHLWMSMTWPRPRPA